MAMDLRNWYEELRESATTLEEAMENAGAFAVGIWSLGEGKYVALEVGPPVPPDAVLVRRRYSPRDAWRYTDGTKDIEAAL